MRLLENARKKVPVLSAPPKEPASSIPTRRYASAPAALRSMAGWKRFRWMLRAAGRLGVTLAITCFAYYFHLNFAATGFLLLLLVLVVALQAGFLQATLVSIFANVCLNYFFIPPVLTFAIADPQNWVALLVFEFSALLVSHLSTEARQQARRATIHREDSERLYEVSRQVLMLAQEGSPEQQMLDAIRRVFPIEGAVLFNGYTAEARLSGQPASELEMHTRSAYFKEQNTDLDDGSTRIRVLRVGVSNIGALAIQGRQMNPAVVNALASLTAIVLERTRSLVRQNQAEAERQTERLRTAVLDALAHEYKTPLTVIRTAASGMLEAGTLAAEQSELVQLIDTETAKLNELTTRLLQMSRLDSADVRVRHDRIDLADLLQTAVASARPFLGRHHIKLEELPEPVAITGDCELIVMALVQFLDNAAKYSDPSSVITISGLVREGEIWIGVNNPGAPILREDRERIFDRFYRSAQALHKAPGTGIGLSISKKVAEVHRGRVWVTSDESRGNTFYLALPRKTL